MKVENSIPYTKLKIAKCRMDHGKEWIFDSSRGNNLTRSILIHLFSKVIYDSKGQSRYHCTRNHSRILAESYSYLYYGGNNDSQCLLCNRTGYDTCMTKNIDYEDFIVNLNIHGCARFEQYIAFHLIEDDVTKYNKKWCLNSDN